MKKKLLSLLLVLCMVLPMVPFGAFTIAAADAEGATVTFINANVSPAETVSTQTVGVVMDFTVPEVPDDGLGWYHVSNTGVIREASTYLYQAAQDMTFYLLPRSSTFSPSSNWPRYTAKTRFDGWTNNWTAGSYIGSSYTLFDNMPADANNMLQNKSIWSYGGIYLAHTQHMITQSAGALALSYHALADGKIDVDFEALGIAYTADGANFSDTLMAVAVNGVVVWPAAAANQAVTAKPFTGTGYTFKYNSNGQQTTYYPTIETSWAYLKLDEQTAAPSEYTSGTDAVVTTVAKTGELMTEYKAYCEKNGYPHGISVSAGDRVDVVFSRVNTPHIYAYPTITYTSVTGEPLSAGDIIMGGDVAGDNYIASSLVTGGENFAAYGSAANPYSLAKDFTGGWDFASYSNGVVDNNLTLDTTYGNIGNWTTGCLWINKLGGVARTMVGIADSYDPKTYGAGFTYKVTQTGTVTAVASFNVMDSMAQLKAVYYSIVKVNADGATVVYPTEGMAGAADVATEGAGIKYTSPGVRKETATFKVESGDQLVFLFRANTVINNYNGLHFINNFRAHLSYAEQILPSSSLVLGSLRADSSNKVVMPAGWKFVGRSVSDYNSMLVLDTLCSNAGVAGAVSGGEGWLMAVGGPTSPRINFWPNRSSRETEGWTWGQWGAVNADGSWNAGLQYTAPFTGYVDISLDNIVSCAANASVGVFVNGAMVWPTASGSYGVQSNWFPLKDRTNGNKAYNVTPELTNTDLLKGVFVEAGDVVEILNKRSSGGYATTIEATVSYSRMLAKGEQYIKMAGMDPIIAKAGDIVTLPKYTGTSAMLGWDADGNGKPDYADGAVFEMPNEILRLTPVTAGSVSFAANGKPIANADKTITYQNGWTAGIYDNGAGKFVPFTYANTGEPVFCHNTSGWGDTSGMYKGSSNRFAMSDKVTADGRYHVGVQYTTDKNGTVLIDFASLELQRECNSSDVAGRLAGGFAIYLNGVKIAPMDEDYYYYESETVYAKGANVYGDMHLLNMFHADGPLSVDVKTGDVIEVRGFKGDAASRMFVINPLITYTEVFSAPAITASAVTLGETFTMNVYASLTSPRLDYTDEVYLVIGNGYELPVSQIVDNTAEDTLFSNVDYVFEIPELPLKYLSMTFDVYMRVYYEDGSYKDSKTVTIGAAEYAKAAIASPETDNDLKLAAAALLEYAVAADAYYFGEDTSYMIPDDMPLMPTIVPENVFNLTEFDGNASITGATLTLNATVGLRVYINTSKNANRFVLLVDDNEEFSSPRRLQLQKRPSGGYMVDIDVSAAEFSEPFYFCVEDLYGDQQSEVLTYSVESYVARQYENEDASAELLDLLDAMLVLCKTANDIA